MADAKNSSTSYDGNGLTGFSYPLDSSVTAVLDPLSRYGGLGNLRKTDGILSRYGYPVSQGQPGMMVRSYTAVVGPQSAQLPGDYLDNMRSMMDPLANPLGMMASGDSYRRPGSTGFDGMELYSAVMSALGADRDDKGGYKLPDAIKPEGAMAIGYLAGMAAQSMGSYGHGGGHMGQHPGCPMCGGQGGLPGNLGGGNLVGYLLSAKENGAGGTASSAASRVSKN